MNDNSEIALLEQIQRVSAPAFLFTRIQGELEARAIGTVAVPKLISWAFALSLLIAINVSAFNEQNASTDSTISSYSSTMGLNTSNQLYNE